MLISQIISTFDNKDIIGVTLTDKEYEQVKEAFQSRRSHANLFVSCKESTNIVSFDRTSLYEYADVILRNIEKG